MTDAKQEMKAARKELGQNSPRNWRGMLAWYGTAAVVGLTSGWLMDEAKKPTIVSTGELSAEQKLAISSQSTTPQQRLASIMAKEKEKCEQNPADTSKLCESFRAQAGKPSTVAQAPAAASATKLDPIQQRLSKYSQAGIDAYNDRNPTKSFEQVAATKLTDVGFGLAAALALSMVARRTGIGRSIPDIIHGPQSIDARHYNNAVKSNFQISEATRTAEIKMGLSPTAAATEKAQDFRTMLERQIPDGWFSFFKPGSPVIKAPKDTPGAVTTVIGEDEVSFIAKPGTTRGEIAAKKKGPTP
jgi:hypothetical protein